ncbi:MAG: acyl carrier protein [Ruminiclostridium sp.]|nr:acyl carrier protein [Ruminiclostridium sp.]
MTNEEKYVGIFTKLFDIDEAQAKELKYQDIPAWDSVGHMSLINEIEETFDISMDADDIIDFESFEKGREILSGDKYGIKM